MICFHKYGKWSKGEIVNIFDNPDAKYPYKRILQQEKACLKCGKIKIRKINF